MRYKSMPLSVRTSARSTEKPRQTPNRPPRRMRDWLATIPIIVLVPAFMLLGDQSEARSPAVLKAPTQVEAATRITLTGYGFPRNTRVQLTWDGQTAGMPAVTTNNRGDLRARVTVPSRSAEGFHTVATRLADRRAPSRYSYSYSARWESLARGRSASSVLASVRLEVVDAPSDDRAASATATARPTSTPTAAPTATVAPTAVPTAVAATAPTPAPRAATPAPRPATPAPAPATPFTATAGVWVNQAELQRLPTSGAAWNSVVSAANVGTGGNISDQDSNHDIETLAAAIYAARTGQQRDRAVAALESAIGTEQGGRWLAVGRNLTGYVIAADLLGIRSGPIYNWLASFPTMRLAHNNSGAPVTMQQSSWDSGSNASAQTGAAVAALAVYLGDGNLLRWSWDGFRRYAGDRSSPHHLTSNSDAWQTAPNDPVGIQNAGATKDGCSIDGAISNDMSRGGDSTCDPGYTQYPWVGLEGAVPAAVILSRAGYPAWDVQSQALRRAAVYLHGLSQSDGEWYDAGRAAEVKHLLNRVYGLGYPAQYPVGGGRIVGFTDYTHP